MSSKDNRMVKGKSLDRGLLKIRPGVQLLERILEEISNSMTTFKPSKSLAMLSALAEEVENDSKVVAEIDITISSGGMKGYFMTGCYHILAEELKKRNIKIARIAGTSAGAWAGLFMCTGLGTTRWVETYYGWKEREGTTIHEAYDDMYLNWIRKILPEDAYKKCNGRLFISISVFNEWGLLENMIVSDYQSNDDLFAACCASSTIPFISERVGGWGSGQWGLRRFRGRLCVDGGLTNAVPVFTDHVRRQLVFQLGELDYSTYRCMTNTDDCIEVLVIRGALLMSQFLEGNQTTTAIQWLDIKDSTSELPVAAQSVSSTVLSQVYQQFQENKYIYLGVVCMSRWYFGEFGLSRAVQTMSSIPIHTVISNLTQYTLTAWNQLMKQWNSTSAGNSLSVGNTLTVFQQSLNQLGNALYNILVNIYS